MAVSIVGWGHLPFAGLKGLCQQRLIIGASRPKERAR